MDETLRQKVRAWIDADPDPDARAELEGLLAAGEEDELRDRFQGPLRFGTAGLRGLLGAGPFRMNRAVVRSATAGLCAYLRATVPDAASRGIVVGFDGRRMSRELAEDAAKVIAAAGITARVYEEVTPTPLVGFSVLDQNAAAGVVVTASHNPPEYNGFKVFWGNGAQIVPPHDAGIAEAIAALGPAKAIPMAEAPRVVLGDAERRRYLDGVRDALVHPEVPRAIGVAYTAMHGVGEAMVRTALAEAGFEKVSSVAEQAEPDGSFPTVAFPNPEEDGALDLVLALAKAEGAELVLANDPDADRLAVCVLHDGRYEQLTGNEIGCLFAHYLLAEGATEGKRAVASSIVSSPMMLAIGEAHGARAEVTLTGHKWIQNRGLDLESEGYRFVFGYEEALGYGVGTLVRDKDGISAAVVMADMAAWCASEGRTLIDERERMWRRYGMFLSEQVSLVRPGSSGAAEIAAMMERAMAPEWPEELGGCRVLARQDYVRGVRQARDGETPLTLPKTNMAVYELEGGHRAMLRPSGTEPKLKLYFDVRVEVGADEAIGDARARGSSLLEGLVRDVRRAFTD